MRKITILFHSGYGHTKRVAEHVQKGVASSDVTVESISIDSEGNLPEAAWQTLQDSDAHHLRHADLYGRSVLAV